MPLCPECRRGAIAFDAPSCPECGWSGGRLEDGIVDMVARRDRESPLFNAYAELYDRIAADDIEAPIQGDELLDLEAERLLEAIGPVTGQAVCDVGVGRGLIFRRLRAAGPRLLVGLDLSAAYLRRLADGDARVRLVRANAESLPFREELDAIVASDVLEHVLNPADFLDSAVTALVPNGRLVVKVPYRENISQYRRAAGCPYEMVHLRTFDRGLLRKALTDSGLRPERVRYSGFYAGRWSRGLRRLPRVAGIVHGRLRRRFGDNPAPNRIDPRLGRLLMEPTVITVVARKP